MLLLLLYSLPLNAPLFSLSVYLPFCLSLPSSSSLSLSSLSVPPFLSLYWLSLVGVEAFLWALNSSTSFFVTCLVSFFCGIV